VHIFPAIDLLDGRCVRLKQGLEQTKKVYSSFPADVAIKWQGMGSRFIHVVNLDGAFGRARKNIEAIEDILSAVNIPIELGGGIRSYEDAASWLDLGVHRIIFGTVALTEPHVVEETVKKFGAERVVAGIDARNGRVTVRGWLDQTDKDAVELALEMKSLGVIRIVYTDVMRDGELVGPNITATLRLAEKTEMGVIASGGFSELQHFQDLADAENPSIEGAIVGTALYENRLDLAALIESFESDK
jgi:phosphoribosylformimino-5-aminoimidazole carboxamide ribotide isomerase